MPDLTTLLEAGYLGVAGVVCVAVWIDNSRVFYIGGRPPSGVLSGIFWPLMALVVAVAGACLLAARGWRSLRALIANSTGKPGDEASQGSPSSAVFPGRPEALHSDGKEE